MASDEFRAFQARAAQQQAKAAPAADIHEQRARIDRGMGQLPLAGGVTAEELDAGGVPVILCQRDGSDADPLVLYFHGGGYRIGSAVAWRSYGSHLAQACKARVALVDYRLAPEHPFPAAVDDALIAYRWSVDRAGSASVIIGGDSAGGGLTAALLVALTGEGLPMPAGAICLPPWVDLTNTADSFRSKSSSDRMFSKQAADEAADLYLAGHDPKDPLASPLFGSWQGMPPLLIQVGGTEVLLDDAEGLARAAKDAGVDASIHVFPEMPHVWQLQYPAFPEAVEAVDEIAAFVALVSR